LAPTKIMLRLQLNCGPVFEDHTTCLGKSRKQKKTSRKN